jgi:RNA polymerase primary sigma factor
MYDADRTKVISELYNSYQANGFVTEDEALSLFSAYSIALSEIDSITELLLTKGVIFLSDDDDEEITDRSRLDYNSIYEEVVSISPGLTTFIDYVKQTTPPQYREWRLLIPKMNSGNRYAFNRLFDMYLRVAIKIALQIHKDTNFDLDDAVQEGIIGIIKALQTYDINENGSLSSYVPLWIKQNITRAIPNTGKLIRIPAHAYETYLEIESFRAEYYRLNGEFPTVEDIAEQQNCSKDTVEQILFAMQDSIEFDVLAEDDDIRSLLYRNGNFYYLEDEINIDELTVALAKAMQNLTDREKRVLTLLYGLDDGIQRTLEDVGGVFKVTRERIRQISSKALRRLNLPTRKRYLKDFIC